MKISRQLAAVTGGLLMLAVLPAQAWWGGNNWGPWGGGNDYYGYNQQPWNYNRDGQDQRWDNSRRNNEWMHGPWNGGSWDEWRAPWSNDDSRWGSGPWDGFGDAMNNFIGEMEGDLDLNMKIRAENEAKAKAKSETQSEFRGNRFGSGNRYGNRNYYPYYGYGMPPYQYYPQQNYPQQPQTQPGPTAPATR